MNVAVATAELYPPCTVDTNVIDEPALQQRHGFSHLIGRNKLGQVPGFSLCVS